MGDSYYAACRWVGYLASSSWDALTNTT